MEIVAEDTIWQKPDEPITVRGIVEALKLRKRGGSRFVRFTLQDNGSLVIQVVGDAVRKARKARSKPVRSIPSSREGKPEELSLTEKAFLDLLAKDIDENPHTLVPVTVEMVERRMALVEGVDVDLDGPLEGED